MTGTSVPKNHSQPTSQYGPRRRPNQTAAGNRQPARASAAATASGEADSDSG